MAMTGAVSDFSQSGGGARKRLEQWLIEADYFGRGETPPPM